MRIRCNSKLLEFEGHRRRSVPQRLIFLFFVSLRAPSCPFVDIFLCFLPLRGLRADVSYHW